MALAWALSLRPVKPLIRYDRFRARTPRELLGSPKTPITRRAMSLYICSGIQPGFRKSSPNPQLAQQPLRHQHRGAHSALNHVFLQTREEPPSQDGGEQGRQAWRSQSHPHADQDPGLGDAEHAFAEVEEGSLKTIQIAASEVLDLIRCQSQPLASPLKSEGAGGLAQDEFGQLLPGSCDPIRQEVGGGWRGIS
jgi:hypothetical protein